MPRPLAAALLLLAFLGTGTIPVFAQDGTAVAKAVEQKVDDLTATLRNLEQVLQDDKVAVEKKAEVIRLVAALIAQLQRENAELRAKDMGGEAESLLAALAAKLDDRNKIVEMFRQALAMAAADNRKSVKLLCAAAARNRELESQLAARPTTAAVTATATATAGPGGYAIAVATAGCPPTTVMVAAPALTPPSCGTFPFRGNSEVHFAFEVRWVPSDGSRPEMVLGTIRGSHGGARVPLSMQHPEEPGMLLLIPQAHGYRTATKPGTATYILVVEADFL